MGERVQLKLCDGHKKWRPSSQTTVFCSSCCDNVPDTSFCLATDGSINQLINQSINQSIQSINSMYFKTHNIEKQTTQIK